MTIGRMLRRDWGELFSETLRQILLGAGIVLLALVLSRGMRATAESQSRSWTRRLPYADSTQLAHTASGDTVRLPLGTPQEMARLEEQMAQIRVRAHLHLRIMSYFYARYFASVTVSAILAVAAGLCLFNITRVGWANANRYLATAFIVTAGLTIFFQLSPKLYKQQENISANKLLYLRYVTTDNELRTYLATGRLAAADSILPLNVVVREVDKRLTELSDFPIGLDEGKVPAFSKLPGMTEP